MFKGFLTVAASCSVCGLDLSGQDSGDAGVPFIILAVGVVVVFSALIVEVKIGWPVWLHLLVWLPLSVVLCMGSIRPLKGLFIALQYRYRRRELDPNA